MGTQSKKHRGREASCLAVVVLALCFTPALRAGELPFPVGIRGGATIASLAFEDLAPGVEGNDRVGYFLAGHVDFPIIPQVAIETGIGFADQGGEIEGSINFFNQTLSGAATIRLTYLYIPLLVKVMAPDLRFKPYVKVGPQLGMLLSSKFEGTPTDPTRPAIETDIDDQTKSTEGSLYFSGGVEFPGRVGSFLEIGYTLGLTGIAEETQYVFSEATNRVLVVTAGFLF